ncbi:MAG: PH domain-containing protein, partial [Candidatus Heimdallarchaeota archaeon]
LKKKSSVRLTLGYDPNLKCLKCFQRPSYIHYCEDCNGTFCTDCLITEKTECTYCNICSHISVGSKCEKCGKESHLPVSRRANKCPMCTSIRLKDINRKIQGLPSEFYEAVEKLGLGLESIKNFATKYTKIVTSAKQLRREHYGLYPTIEAGLMRIQQLFFQTRQRANELVEKVYDHILPEAKNLSFNRNMTINQLTRIDKTINLIETHAMSYSNLIEDFLDKPQKELLSIEDKVVELKNYTFLFDEVADKFEPEAYELKIAAFPNIKLAFPDERNSKQGTLFITNKKLYFLPQHKFIFTFLGKVKNIELSSIKDVETKSRKIFGNKMLINLPEKRKIKIKGSNVDLERLNTIFQNLFTERDGYVTTDPYMMEGFTINLNFNNLQDRVDKRINDLKQAPYKSIPRPDRGGWINDPRPPPVIRETEETKNLRIELKAARDTLRELIKAFNDRSITPDIYFSRREKTKQRILSLEEELNDVQRLSPSLARLNQIMNYYSNNQPENYHQR